MQNTQTFNVIKHLFKGAFWNGDTWIMPSSTKDVLMCALCDDLDEALDEFIEFKNSILEDVAAHCYLSKIVIVTKIIF